MTVDEAIRLGEEFGIAVGEVDEEIQKELKLERPEGVAVFEVIGNSRRRLCRHQGSIRHQGNRQKGSSEPDRFRESLKRAMKGM